MGSRSVRRGALLVFLFAGTISLLAQTAMVTPGPVFPNRPPAGYARPPIHLEATNPLVPTGITPTQIRKYYGFSSLSNTGSGQTIAIVDAYDDPNIASDLNHFNSTFGLAPCTTSNGCFTKIYASGTKPTTNSGWALEISLDVEWAHAIAPHARIVLVEASSSQLSALLHAVDVAVQHGAGVVSMSWGGSEFSSEHTYDTHFAINGVTFVASSGDNGHGVIWPATSPDVVSVGGTTVKTDSAGDYLGESAWVDSGGGLSAYELEPSFQSNYPVPNANGKRVNPDVAYSANPSVGFPVYDTVPFQGVSGWFEVGGTSAGSPQWSALFAITNSIRAGKGKGHLSHTPSLVYQAAKGSYSTRFHDITSGNNGSCGWVCNTHTNFDDVTGLGSPRAYNLVNALSNF
jgi:subtilase family serine protease